ncbi:NADH dehydrogenase FAD-containing subunit [Rubrobacter radiotolerans]|uniref:NAD(P)/FAD-dependent oxidoreductase n=1 Tax=Rubrobacter radiotolerans TaxID=42256 RepID=A0A023X1Z2_RUBRA|nr:NAD(P)/FAD-dependent oxidoreductase [Rubrobacter radiotolerans]AHY46368.1 NADH dehydrogenase FAD-containing subunit [Rubrobacter radiotolerans]MDX5893775.1 NAD(P)/FAD-dependent oxidoreductase [Rubrobacter radiotolerans]SMC04479.1 NADH dehydrogenase [Rubrobacter radiotolerans DSM 5868]
MKRVGKLALAAGAVAGGVALKRALEPEPRYEVWERRPFRDFEKKVLIVGGGFGGYTAAKELCRLTERREDVGVMVVSRENYFTFWPMLAGIISSGIESRNVAQPIRRALIRHGASFRRAELEAVDPQQQTVRASAATIPYDHLVLALGASPAYFGIPGVEEHAISIRGISAGEEIRNRVIERYEETTLARGEVPDSKLTFVVIGGGATGVETAAELHTLVRKTLAPDYPNIDPRRVRIVLVDANPEVLKEIDPSLRKLARKKLAQLDVEVRNNVRAREITAEKVVLNDGTEILSENVIWTAGSRASESLANLPFDHDERRGLATDACLRVRGYTNVWGIGDCAANTSSDGSPVPPNAQAAVQMGRAVARNVLAALDGREPEPFTYRSAGQLVEIGSEYAVNDVMGLKFSGLLASLFWRATYLYKLESPQSRLRIGLDWFLDLFTDPAVTQIRR